MLGKEIPELMKLIQKEEAQAVVKQKTEAPIKGVWDINIWWSNIHTPRNDWLFIFIHLL